MLFRKYITTNVLEDLCSQQQHDTKPCLRQPECANLFDVDEVHLCLCLAKTQVDVQYNPKHYKENEN